VVLTTLLSYPKVYLKLKVLVLIIKFLLTQVLKIFKLIKDLKTKEKMKQQYKAQTIINLNTEMKNVRISKK